MEFEFRYPVAVDATEADQKLPALFEHFTVPSYLTKEDVAVLSGLQVIAYGDVIQTAAFEEGAEAAWAAFDYQVFGKSVAEQPDPEAGGEDENTQEPTEDIEP